jgi:hypothetical protein
MTIVVAAHGLIRANQLTSIHGTRSAVRSDSGLRSRTVPDICCRPENWIDKVAQLRPAKRALRTSWFACCIPVRPFEVTSANGGVNYITVACEHGTEGGQTCGLIIDQQDANGSLTMHLLQLYHLQFNTLQYKHSYHRVEPAAQAPTSRGFRPRPAESHRYVEKRRAASSLE